MQRLTAEKILAVWETGRSQHALDRALTILMAASPGASRASLADLSIGERDARLLQLRTLVLGARAEGFAECPRCAERVEFPLDTAEILEGRAPSRPSESSAPCEIETHGQSITFRLPTSRDLAQVAVQPDKTQALQSLVKSCFLAPTDPDFPGEIIEAVGQAMLAADPLAETTLRLSCPACAHEWESFFEIAEFFWSEIVVQAQQLLREIDALARAYGWTECEILNLPAQRRQTYLELVAA